MDKKMLKALAAAERLMDEGKVPYVRMLNSYNEYERMAVSPSIMEELGLETGQTINKILLDAIFERSMDILKNTLGEIVQKTEDMQLTEDFDFRTMMGDKE